MKILLTGANGYIGRYLAEHLKKLSIKVIPIYSQNSNNAGYKCDLTQADELKAINQLDFDAVIHTAAHVPLISGRIDSKEGANINMLIDRNIVDLAAAKNAYLVYFSTCGLYNIFDPSVKTENSTLESRSYYFESKLHGERLAIEYANSSILRISSPYIETALPNNVIKIFADQLKTNKKLEIWGDGSNEQDFMNLSDLSVWLQALMHKKTKGIFNAVSGYAMSMYQLAKHIKANQEGTISFVASQEPKRYARYDNRKITSYTSHIATRIGDITLNV